MSVDIAGTDGLGLTCYTPVRSGLAGLKHQLQTQAVASPQTVAKIREIAPGGVNCLPPRSLIPASPDTRLEPDPMYAAQRSRLGGRADLCDPVIRHHLRLAPLPDPYEERRRAAEYWQKERHKHVLP